MGHLKGGAAEGLHQISRHRVGVCRDVANRWIVLRVHRIDDVVVEVADFMLLAHLRRDVFNSVFNPRIAFAISLFEPQAVIPGLPAFVVARPARSPVGDMMS